MRVEVPVLVGKHVRLEPLSVAHADGLTAASAEGANLYRWSFVPQTRAQVVAYIEAALAARDRGAQVPFATVRASDGYVIGSTRFCYLDRWTWPKSHPRYGRSAPDVCEVGFTWLSPNAVRTAANTEAKFLMLRHAFENWDVYSVCFHTDVRNERSRTAIERIGGRFEGVLRAHRISVDFAPRDSARYAITADEWPGVKAGFLRRLA